jgi:hypothetical protein
VSYVRARVMTLAMAAGLAACTGPTDGAARVELPPPGAPEPGMPGPGPRARAFDAVDANTACEGCHRDIAAEWRASLHHAAHREPTFVAQLAREPFAFCTHCHAPEAAPGEREGPRVDLGVGCVTCHLVGEAVLAAPGKESRADAHPTARAAAFAAPPACAGCHEFAFPDQRGPRPLMMQMTVSEHAASAHADQSCAACHMPLVAGPNGPHRSHRFGASRDEAMVRAAVAIERTFAEGELALRLRPGEVGHAFPTGDMLRRLSLEIEVRDAEGAVIDRDLRHFTRRFAFEASPRRAPRRTAGRDDRVGVDGVVDHRFRPRALPRGGELRWELRYERVADPSAADPIAGAIVVAEERLPIDDGSIHGDQSTHRD